MKKSKNAKKGKRTGPREPPARAGHIMTTFSNDTVSMMGGYSTAGPLCDAWIYSDTKKWSQLSASKNSAGPFPRMMADGCYVNGDLYVVAGMKQENDDILILNDVWKLHKSNDQYSWVCLHEESPIPERHSHVVVAIPGGRMIVHGGECIDFLNDCWLFDSLHNSFLQIPTPADASPCPRSSHSAAYSAPYIVLFGGMTSTASAMGGAEEPSGLPKDTTPVYLNDLWLLDTSRTDVSWTMVSLRGLAPSPRDLPAMATVEGATGRSGDVLIFGGYGLYTTEDDDEEEETGADGQGGALSLKPSGGEPDEVMAGLSLEDVAVNMTASTSTPPTTASSSGGDMTVAADEGECSVPLELQALRNALPREEQGGVEPSVATTVKGACKEALGHDTDSDESVAEGYLNDTWVVNVHSLECQEVDLRCGESPAGNGKNQGRTLAQLCSSGLRGAKIVVLNTDVSSHEGVAAGAEEPLRQTGRLMLSGGFDGENFGGIIDNLHVI